MRWMLAALLLVPAQDDNPYEKFQTRVAGAKTIRTEIKVVVLDGSRVEVRVQGTLKLRGADRFSIDYEYWEGRSRDAERGTVLCDGRKIIATGPRDLGLRGDEPIERIASNLRNALSGSMLTVFAMLERGAGRDIGGEISDIQDRGKTKLDGADARLIEYSLSYSVRGLEGDKLPAKLYLSADGSRPIRREVSIEGAQWIETYKTFEVDEDLPESDFSYQSQRRLSRARCAQVARSVELHGRFMGRYPASLDALVEGGFVLGGAVPRDGWGRPFTLAVEKGVVHVRGFGADGKAGGTGDDEDVDVPVPPLSRRAIVPPTEELKRQFQARLQLHLLVAAVAAFRDTYGELPRKKAALWEKPDWATVWPEGGWIGGTSMPKDPWSQPYRMISDRESVRFQIQDPKAHRLSWRQLTDDEKRLLEEGAKPRFTDEELRQIASAIDRLADDDLEVREESEVELAAWGPAIVPHLQEKLKTERDSETAARLQRVLRSITVPPLEWRVELGALAMTVGTGDDRMTEVERHASGSLKTIATAQADFRSNDRDDNRVNDFWTGDLAGLYAIAPRGHAIKLIEVSVALSDPAPLEGGKLACYPDPITKHGEAGPKSGYHFRALREDLSTQPASTVYAQDTDGSGEKCRNSSRFGAVAYPAEYGVDGTKTFIINEGNTMFWKDTGGEPVLDWPTDAEVAESWHKVDW